MLTLTNVRQSPILALTMLAAGIGNIHGKYPANWKGLDFDALAKTKELIGDLAACSSRRYRYSCRYDSRRQFHLALQKSMLIQSVSYTSKRLQESISKKVKTLKVKVLTQENFLLQVLRLLKLLLKKRWNFSVQSTKHNFSNEQTPLIILFDKGCIFMIKKLKIFSVVIFVSLLYCGILGIVFNSVSSVPVLSVNISDGVDMPIIMYHSVLKDTDLSGKYIVTPDTLKNDINFLKNKGYTFVSAQELIDYTNGTSKLPDKPVMLTFDDGFYNNYGYVMPILSEYDAKAVISVVGSYTDEYSKSNIANMTYGYVRWSEVYDMFIDKRVEVGNHSYDFHSNNHGRNGSKRNSGESEDTYKNIFVDDTQKAQDRFMTKTGFAPIIYTYPFGAYSEETTDMLKSMGFKMSLTCNEGINHITDADSLFMLKRYNRPSGISTADFFAKMGID